MFNKLREDNKHKLGEFSKELSFITNPKIRNITEIAICYIHPLFFQVSASATGKHHPTYGLGLRGLLRHTKAAVNIANELKVINSLDMSDKDYDISIAALILHDSCKRGVHFENENTCHEHPLLVRNLVPEGTFFDDDLIIWNDICDAISTHMGQWTTASHSTITLPAPKTNIQKFVHLCDYLASRKMLEAVNIWNEEDMDIICMENKNKQTQEQVEPMTQKQANYIKSLVAEYRNSCDVLNIDCQYKNDDFSFLNKKTAGGFIGKIKKLLEKNKKLMAEKG